MNFSPPPVDSETETDDFTPPPVESFTPPPSDSVTTKKADLVSQLQTERRKGKLIGALGDVIDFLKGQTEYATHDPISNLTDVAHEVLEGSGAVKPGTFQPTDPNAPFVPIPKPSGDTTGAGIARGVIGLVEGIETPQNAPFLALGQVGPGVQRAAAATLAGKMITDIPKSVEQLREVSETGTPAQKAEAAVGLGAQVVLPTLIAGGYNISGKGKPLLPRTTEAIKEVSPDAVQESETTPVLRDVPDQSGESTGQMPATEGAQGISQRDLPQENAGGTEVPVVPNVVSEMIGPGAKTKGEPDYSAIHQLTDQLNETPVEGIKKRVSLREQGAKVLEAGQDAITKIVNGFRSISNSLKETARGVRAPTDVDRRVSDLDWALQKSSGLSHKAGEVIEKQIPDKTTREALAIWIDSGGDENLIRNALDTLPEKTPTNVRAALEKATRLSDSEKASGESLRQYFGIRENDAVSHDIFDQGLKDYFTHIWKSEKNLPDSVHAAISSGRVRTYFQFGRQRTIGRFIEGIQQGKVPELDPAKIVPYYNYALDRAIASRRFIKELSDLEAPDGRPVLAPTGVRMEVDHPTSGEAMLIKPHARSGEIGDYESINHPALRKWKWAGTDENGNPILYQSDMLVHPDYYERLARMMDRSRMAGTKIGSALLRASTEVKGFKLGLLSLFHQIHVGSHALGHWTDPFRVGEINWDAPETRFAVEKGHLKLAPDPGDLANFSEGLLSPGLVHKIPLVGPWSRAYGQWLFGDYIPRLKLKTFQNALQRNLDHYSKDIESGNVTPEEIASRVGDAVNNAYGELNHLFLGKYGRDPRFQRMLRAVFLAPDFGEARLRFVEKAFTKYGHEERIALATLFTTFYAAARIGNYLSHGDPEWDWKRAFSVKAGGHWWSMRSAAGDVLNAINDFGRFMHHRLNPLYSRTIIEALTGRDITGKKAGRLDQVKDFANQIVPIQLGGFTRQDQKVWESFLTAMGLSAYRDRPQSDVQKLVGEWLGKSDDPKLKELYELRQKQEFGEGPYTALRNAIQTNDANGVKKAYEKLSKAHSDSEITKALMAFSQRPFTGSQKYEREFYNGLSDADKKLYDQALQERRSTFTRFQELLSK